MKKLSVVVPTYNLGSYLKGMLEDLDKQTSPIELLIVDDGSTDETPQVIRDFAATRWWVNYERFSEHQGVGAARNFGLDHARGDAIAFVDGDDLVAPDFAERLLAGFKPGIAAVAVGYDWWTRPKVTGGGYRHLTQLEMFDQVSRHGTEVGGYVWNKAFSTVVLRSINLRFDENLPLAEDYLFVASFVSQASGSYSYWPKVLYTKRNRPDSTIHTAGRAAREEERAVFEKIAAMRSTLIDRGK